MANLLQSSQNKSTCAPSYYTNYLQNLATKGQQAQCCAKFVGAQPLQTEAFCKAATNFGAQQGNFATAQNLLGCAANQNITGAAAPFLTAGTSTTPLTELQPYANQAMATTGVQAATPDISKGTALCAAGAASPYIQQAAAKGGLCAANPYLSKVSGTCTAQLAQSYMSPYLQSAVQSMSDIANRNIQQNLAPQATAAAVGSGQFGSQRGAQVLGQVEANAEQCLNSQIANMENQGYNTALGAAGQKQQICAGLGSTAGTLTEQQQSLLGNLGSTTGQLTSAQMQNLINAGGTLGQQQTSANQIAAGLGSTAANAQQGFNTSNLQAGQTAGTMAAEQARALTAAGQGMGSLGVQAAGQNLACINALATLGAQCQTIKQNQQCYPFTTLSKLSSLLQGAQVPTSVKTTMCMSPLSAAATVGSAAAGLFQQKYDANGNPIANSSLFCQIGCKLSCWYKKATGCAEGGLVTARNGGVIGCRSTRHMGGLPGGRK